MSHTSVHNSRFLLHDDEDSLQNMYSNTKGKKIYISCAMVKKFEK